MVTKNGKSTKSLMVLLFAMGILIESNASSYSEAPAQTVLKLASPSLRAPQFRQAKTQIIYDQKVYSWFADLIRSAQRSIVMDIYIFGGEKADFLVDLIAQRVKQGVFVQVILDKSFGTLPNTTRFTKSTYRKLVQSGAQVVLSSRVNYHKKQKKSGPIDHNKYLVIDGSRALVGSTNFAPMFDRYHDLMVYVEGETAQDLYQQFQYDFFNAKNPQLLASPQEPFIHLTQDYPKVVPGAQEKGYVRVISTGRGRQTIEESLLQLIDRSQASIDIQMHQFDPVPEIMQRLIAAHKRGVKIRVLLDPSDWQYIIFGGKLVPKGVLNAATILAFQKAGIPVKFYPVSKETTTAHMKLAVVDGKILFVGSMNWTEGGLRFVNETNLEIVGGRTPRDSQLVFDEDWKKSSEVKLNGKLAIWAWSLLQKLGI